MTSSIVIVDLHVLHIELGGDSGFVSASRSPRNRKVGFRGHSSMISSIVLMYLHLLVGELGDRFGSLYMSRSPSEPRGWFSWPQLHD